MSRLLHSLADAGLDLAASDQLGHAPFLVAISRIGQNGQRADALAICQAIMTAVKTHCDLPAFLNKSVNMGGAPALSAYVSVAALLSDAQLLSLLLEHGACGLLGPDGVVDPSILFFAKQNRQEVADVLLRHADRTLTPTHWQGLLLSLAELVADAAQAYTDFAFSDYMLKAIAARGADLVAAQATLTPFLHACMVERSGTVAGQLLQVIGDQRAFLTQPASALGGTPLYIAVDSGNAGAVKHVLQAMVAADPPIPLSKDLLCIANEQPAPFGSLANNHLAAVLSELLPAGRLA